MRGRSRHISENHADEIMTRSLVVLGALVHDYHVSIIYHKERDNAPLVCSLKINASSLFCCIGIVQYIP